MKNKTYFLNTMLAAVMAVTLLALVLVRAFMPLVILPKINIPNLMILILVPLLLDHYLAKNAKRCYVCVFLFSTLTFGLLPSAAGYVGAGEVVKLALVGGVLFTVVTFLFTSAWDRLSTGPVCKAAPILSAVGLYLASQCLMGIIL